jgi:phenylalanyl-tRNA synthetase beta chain
LDVTYSPADHPVFHPGKSALIRSGNAVLGIFSELHPLVKEHYDFGLAPVLAADLDRTLTDSEAAKIRQRIVQALEKEMGAKLHS